MNSDHVITAAEAQALLLDGKGWPGMRIEGLLEFSKVPAGKLRLPPRLHVEALDLSACPDFDELPPGLTCFELNLANTKVHDVPPDLRVESMLNLSH